VERNTDKVYSPCTGTKYNRTSHILSKKEKNTRGRRLFAIVTIMMKLISLNVEGTKHVLQVTKFLESQKADVVCLQEVTESMLEILKKLGYHTHFLPYCIHNNELEGIVITSKLPSQFSSHYYYFPEWGITERDIQNLRETYAQGIVTARIETGTGIYTIATTHFTWNKEGEVASENQRTDMSALLSFTKQLPPHILCGDFNIPRNHNPLYEQLLSGYVDAIPRQYTSSLDKNIHRCGSDNSKAHLFDSFMVDYIFTMKPYTATDVHLVFGVSDHAAVTATIQQ